jgi:hypothetical protein
MQYNQLLQAQQNDQARLFAQQGHNVNYHNNNNNNVFFELKNGGQQNDEQNQPAKNTPHLLPNQPKKQPLQTDLQDSGQYNASFQYHNDKNKTSSPGQNIQNMYQNPSYYSQYDQNVHFQSQHEFDSGYYGDKGYYSTQHGFDDGDDDDDDDDVSDHDDAYGQYQQQYLHQQDGYYQQPNLGSQGRNQPGVLQQYAQSKLSEQTGRENFPGRGNFGSSIAGFGGDGHNNSPANNFGNSYNNNHSSLHNGINQYPNQHNSYQQMYHGHQQPPQHLHYSGYSSDDEI